MRCYLVEVYEGRLLTRTLEFDTMLEAKLEAHFIQKNGDTAVIRKVML